MLKIKQTLYFDDTFIHENNRNRIYGKHTKHQVLFERGRQEMIKFAHSIDLKIL